MGRVPVECGVEGWRDGGREEMAGRDSEDWAMDGKMGWMSAQTDGRIQVLLPIHPGRSIHHLL